MLVLSRRQNEKIVFPCIQASVQVVGVKGGVVRLGIEAPPEVDIFREEAQAPAACWRPFQTKVPQGTAHAKQRQLQQQTREGLKLASTGLGLARLQLASGHIQEAQALLDRIHEDIQSLRQRLERKGRRELPRSSVKSRNGPLPHGRGSEGTGESRDLPERAGMAMVASSGTKGM